MTHNRLGNNSAIGNRKFDIFVMGIDTTTLSSAPEGRTIDFGKDDPFKGWTPAAFTMFFPRGDITDEYTNVWAIGGSSTIGGPNPTATDNLLIGGYTRDPSYPNDVSYLIDGIQKEIQIYLMCLLTLQGSDPFETTRGTSFLDMMNRSSSALETARAEVEIYILEAFNQYQDNTFSTFGERITTVTLQHLFKTGDEFLVVGLRILTSSGEHSTIQIPIKGTLA